MFKMLPFITETSTVTGEYIQLLCSLKSPPLMSMYFLGEAGTEQVLYLKYL
jgi:hypothetical protein